MSTQSIRMRAREVCEILACSRDLLYKLDRQGRLRKYNEGIRFTYWLRSEVESYARGENPYAGKDNAQGQEVAAHA